MGSLRHILLKVFCANLLSKYFVFYIVMTLVYCVAGLEKVEEKINKQGNGERLDIFQFINDLNDKQENIAF